MKKLRKVVIPIAGLGTRMLPATKAIPKEMLPVVDKPIIQSTGGQIYNFFNDIYFKLPNGRIGSIDLFLGSKKNNKFVNLEVTVHPSAFAEIG